MYSGSYLPDLVMIISVPRSWNLSHSSFVSRRHCTPSISLQSPWILPHSDDTSSASDDSTWLATLRHESLNESRASFGDDSVVSTSFSATSSASIDQLINYFQIQPTQTSSSWTLYQSIANVDNFFISRIRAVC